MPVYKTPLRDMRFVYNELLDAAEISSLPGYEEATPDLVDAILEEAARFCEEQLQPLNRSGDEEGCSFDNGRVTTPKGVKEAYQAFIERAGVPSPPILNMAARACRRASI